MKFSKALALTSALTVVLAASSANAITIELRNTGGAEVGTQARAGFEVAAHFWEKMLTNTTSVKLNVGFQALPPNVLGSTGSTTQVAYVGQVLPQLAATGNSALDAIAAANFNTEASPYVGGQAIDALISGPKANGTGVQIPLTTKLDNDRDANNSAFSANTSLLKAIGITPTYTGANAAIMADGSITFSNQFAFDFDPTNGIDANAFDFVGVAIHEIGHALGFRSGVDVYDANTNFGGDLDNGFAIMSIWDIFRYSDQSIAQGVRDWQIGGTPYFSIDGQTMYGDDSHFSTGATFGDGRQASHWKDSPVGQPQLGNLDPTSGRGQQQDITSLDLAAYDAMGWNIAYDVMAQSHRRFSTADVHGAGIPEPASWALMIAGFGLAGGALRRRRETLVRA